MQTARHETGRTRALSLSRRGVVQLALAAALITPSAAQTDVTAPVERLHAALHAASDGERSFAARLALVAPAVAATFDFATMSRATVGAAWADFDAAERAALAARFEAFAAANYAASFDGPNAVTFQMLGTRPDRGGRTWVETELVRSNGETVSFDYLVHDTAAGPRIINVVVDGAVSELARRRAEFRALLEQGGLELLLDTLERRAGEADTGTPS